MNNYIIKGIYRHVNILRNCPIYILILQFRQTIGCQVIDFSQKTICAISDEEMKMRNKG